jgi:anthranilate phosphoribosyltransferase
MAPDFASLVEDDGQGGRVLRPLDAQGACSLLAALLTDEVPASGRAALLAALCARPALLPELTGYARALDGHAGRLEMPRDGPRPVALPAYGGTRRQANLTALLALLLRRYGVPVLVHGVLGGGAALAHGGQDAASGESGQGRVATAAVLWELGVEPAANVADAQSRLLRDSIAYLPVHVLAPGFARLLAGIPGRSSFSTLAPLVDPFAGDGYRVFAVARDDDLPLMRDVLRTTRAAGLLLVGTEGEPFANPRRQPQLEHLADGVATVCVDAETSESAPDPELPATIDARATAAWIERVLAGTRPVPPPLVAQLGCCLAGARRLGVAA